MKPLIALVLAASSLLADVRLPPYKRQVLPNGIVLDIIPRHDVPLVTLRFVVRGGVESEPPELSGLASVTAEALRRGTTTRSADAFSLQLDELGATFVTAASMDASSLTTEFLAKDFEKGLTLAADALLRPSFPEAEMKKLLAQRIDAVKALKDNPGAAASEYYRSFFFGPQHPYGRPADAETLGRIDRKAIADYHKQMYAGRNLIIVVAGDVDPDTAAAAVTKEFGDLPEGSAYQWKQAKLPETKGARVGIVDRPDATETQFRIGTPGISRTDPDRIPLWLVNTLFGGRFTSMLNEALRVNSGLTYGAGSFYDQNHLRGRISISSFTATATTIRAIDMAVDLLSRLAEKGITEQQLTSAKAYLKGTYPPQHLETPDQLADVLADIELFDLNRDEVDDLFARIDAVTVEQANAIARKYYSPGDLTFLLLGKASSFAEGMKKYDAKAVQVPITDPGLRVTH